MASDQIPRNSPATLSHVFAIGETGTNPAPDTATLGITRADGTTLVAAGTAATNGADGLFTYALVPQADLDLLTVTWVATFSGQTVTQVDYVEIVGGFYVSLNEIRALPGLSSTSVFPEAALRRKRREFESLAERYTGVAWVPRFARETVTGSTGTRLWLSHMRPTRILGASSTDTTGTVTAYTTSNWRLDPAGWIITDGDSLAATTYGERNLAVAYEHGHPYPPPELADAARMWIRHKLLTEQSGVGRDLLSAVDPETGGTTRYSTPDWNAGRPTGLLDVDNVLSSLGRAVPVIA